MTKQEQLERIYKGARYFYKMKPSQFSYRLPSEWNHLMKFCKMIMDLEESELEDRVKDTLMRPEIETQTLPLEEK